VAFHLHSYVFGVAIGRDIAHSDEACAVGFSTDNANRSFYFESAGLNFAEVRESGDQANGAVAAHADVADIIEKDDTELAGRVGGFAEECAHNGVVAAGFVDDSGTKAVMRCTKARETVTHAAAAKIRATGNNQPRGLTAGMRIHYLNAHLLFDHHGMALRRTAD
jgi:hypothetical protein